MKSVFYSMEEIDKNLSEQVRTVTDKIHELLDGPDGNGQLDDTYETEQIVLTVPKGFTYQALYLEKLKQAKGKPVKNWPLYEEAWSYGSKAKTVFDRNVRKYIRHHLTHMLYNELHAELHFLCHGENEGLYPHSHSQITLDKPSPPDQDVHNDMPF